MRMMEYKMSIHIMEQIGFLQRIYPTILSIISPKVSVLNYFFDLKNHHSCNHIRSLHSNGIINSHLCVNAKTTISHTEMDSSYTIISVPIQPFPTYKKVGTKFNFNIQPNQRIVINMMENTLILFSGFMLSHNQSNNDVKEDNSIFLNVATYANKRLFENMWQSFIRIYKV